VQRNAVAGCADLRLRAVNFADAHACRQVFGGSVSCFCARLLHSDIVLNTAFSRAVFSGRAATQLAKQFAVPGGETFKES